MAQLIDGHNKNFFIELHELMIKHQVDHIAAWADKVVIKFAPDDYSFMVEFLTMNRDAMVVNKLTQEFFDVTLINQRKIDAKETDAR